MILLLLATGIVGCGGAAESSEEVDFSFHCNESRGALATYQLMLAGQARIDPAGMATDMIRRLATERNAPAVILGHIDAWEKAADARDDALRAIPPVISGGRFIEPDTTSIDREMMQSIAPHADALAEWVAQECGKP
jgi:hypothetical protein